MLENIWRYQKIFEDIRRYQKILENIKNILEEALTCNKDEHISLDGLNYLMLVFEDMYETIKENPNVKIVFNIPENEGDYLIFVLQL